MFFLVLMYPRPGRAKNGVFSNASPAAPLQSGSIAELDDILWSGTARSTPICPNGVCPPTKIAR